MPHSGAGGPPKGGPPALRFVRRIFPAVHAAGAASAAGVRRSEGTGDRGQFMVYFGSNIDRTRGRFFARTLRKIGVFRFSVESGFRAAGEFFSGYCTGSYQKAGVSGGRI